MELVVIILILLFLFAACLFIAGVLALLLIAAVLWLLATIVQSKLVIVLGVCLVMLYLFLHMFPAALIAASLTIGGIVLRAWRGVLNRYRWVGV